MTDREIFRRNFNTLLSKTKTKQIDIARYAEVSYQTVSAWVTGRGYPRADAMEKICRFFGIKQSTLTEDQIEKEADEDKLLTAFRSLPDEGKTKLLERANELLTLYPRRRKHNGKAEAEK